MRKILLFGLCVAFATLGLNAQAPSLSNLKHFYDFMREGVAFDLVGEAHGDIDEAAVISGGVLDLTGGGAQTAFLTLPADEIAINTYTALTIETWADGTGPLQGGKMMWSFGQAGELGTQTPGFKYLFFTPSRFGGTGAARMSVGDDAPWANEEGINFDNATDIFTAGTLYHYVLTIDEDNVMKVYVNGELLQIGADRNTPASVTIPATHQLSNLSNDHAFIGRAVYAADEFWKGKVHLFSIWDAALTDAEVKWLFDQGKDRELDEDTSVDKFNQAAIDVYTANNRLFVRNFENLPNLSITVYNIQGSVVFQTNAFENGKHLDLRQGIYLVKANSGTNTSVKKIVVK
jgi:hypothetical protein